MKLTGKDLYNNYQTLIESVCRKVLKDEELTKDAVQDVWVEIFKSIDSFKEESKLSTWIYTIIKRVVFKTQKKESRYDWKFYKRYMENQKSYEKYPENFDIKEWVLLNCNKCIDGMIHCIHKDNRFLFILREIFKRPYSEIAIITNKSEASLRKAFSRSKKRLNLFLKKQCTLYNPNGRCVCSMKKIIEKTDIRVELNKIGLAVENIYYMYEKKLVLEIDSLNKI